jgi:hypothetical protein
MNKNIRLFVHSFTYRKLIIITGTIVVLVMIVFFSFRNIILRHIIETKIEVFDNKYPAKLIIDDAHFIGILGIEFKGVRILPDKKDTLFSSASIYVALKFFPLLLGNISIDNLEISGIKINMIKKDTVDNYSFFLTKKPRQKIETDYSTRIDKLADAVFEKIPERFSLENFILHTAIDSSNASLFIDELKLVNHHFIAPFKISEGKISNIIIAEGSIRKSNRTASLKLYAQSGSVNIPMVRRMWGLTLSFDTLQTGIRENQLKGSYMQLSGYTSVSGLLLNHKKISVNDVKMQNASFDYNFKIGKDFIELDSSSELKYNKLVLNPYLLYQNNDSKKITFKLNNKFSAQDFFESLPSGLFTNFEGIKTNGDLKLSVDFFVDMKLPDSLKFDASFTESDFKVNNFGVTDFSMINKPFTYTAYEAGDPVESFSVGDDNPEFVSLYQIATCLKEAVLISENGDFYFSNGFNKETFRLAIAENIKAKRFVRGGSTIDMQLVKNVFLSKNKTIARKIEEMLIVWLIETNNLCSKDRMYEVYLNVIEWGPRIYGIYEAARFYFNKTPGELNLAESIYLASIIPKPKWFKYSFDKDGTLNKNLNQSYFNTLADLLLKKSVISESDTAKLLPKVKIKGASRLYMARDTANFKIDSLMNNDE